MEPVTLARSVELQRVWECLDALGVALHSKENSEQRETNHLMT